MLNVQSPQGGRSRLRSNQLLSVVALLTLAGAIIVNSNSAASAAVRHHHLGDNHHSSDNHKSAAAATTTTTAATTGTTAPEQLQILGNNCDNSNLLLHTGFQDAPRCVTTQFGEVSTAPNNPSILITDAPSKVPVGQDFKIQVSSRNLVRDRFLKAGDGGYYLESSFLAADGIERGHFHTSCRMLDSTKVAPVADAVPAFFLATEDGKGGAAPDTVTIDVPTGMPSTGVAQCAVWAGDGSHRIPMMQRANETPAFDAVRIKVVAAATSGGDANN